MERPPRHLELDPKPIDLLETKRSVLNQLRGQDWQMPSSEHSAKLDYNVLKIACTNLVADDSELFAQWLTRVQQLAGWRLINTNHGSRFSVAHFLTPRLGELTKPLPGVTITPKIDAAGDFVTIGTLVLKVTPLTPIEYVKSSWMDSYDYQRAASVTMERNTDQEQNTDPLSDLRRNPKVAENNFLAEFMLGMRQLCAAGYTTVFGQPTDWRRVRVYQALGMDIVNASENDTRSVLDLRTWKRIQRYPTTV